ncbi:MAG TPA: PilT/PilU family type 4a pilus ATPase, partial [Gammaproteobacteria bacterium]|nr:PilT/PilU family type 4a pilus ATPase [Gammaproteobacteria bacterium]
MVFNDLLKMMVEKGASDLFITAGVAPSLKVHGEIKPVTEAVLTTEQARDVVMSVMNAHQRSEFERTLECNFAIGVAGLGRFRVNVFQQRNSIGMVLRRIQTEIPKLEDLGLPPILQDISMTKRGLVIFVGGTGTGKSTSLAAMIGYRNQNSSGHIISIEDPIEYVHRHQNCIITQREVGVDTESFETALKNTLRQAPDVILIGEIRDRETMSHAIAFAETGHLCLSTLHANSANQALDRIVNFFPDDRRDQLLMDLSLNLKAVIAQRLLPRADGKGRCAAIEIMLNTPLMSDLLLKGAVHDIKALMTRSTEAGMQTFDQALYDLYQKGEITYEDAVRYADSANDLRLMVKLHDEQKMKKIGSTLEGV